MKTSFGMVRLSFRGAESVRRRLQPERAVDLAALSFRRFEIDVKFCRWRVHHL